MATSVSSKNYAKAGSVALISIAMIVASYLHEAIVTVNYTFIIVDGIVLVSLVFVAVMPFMDTTKIDELAHILSEISGQPVSKYEQMLEKIAAITDRIDSMMGHYSELTALIKALVESHLNPSTQSTPASGTTTSPPK